MLTCNTFPLCLRVLNSIHFYFMHTVVQFLLKTFQ
uniref:Uncharacterized protein n=1 Tax=Anguilla anguilla TaxID=7936 RepID=A0A0E9XYA9_ANGAN